MEPSLCILTFPQYYQNGRITFNIVVIPRNLNPLLPLEAGLPAFADTELLFKAMVINSLDGLPLAGNALESSSLIIENQITSSREIWEALKTQMELTDGMKISDAESGKAIIGLLNSKVSILSCAMRARCPKISPLKPLPR